MIARAGKPAGDNSRAAQARVRLRSASLRDPETPGPCTVPPGGHAPPGGRSSPCVDRPLVLASSCCLTGYEGVVVLLRHLACPFFLERRFQARDPLVIPGNIVGLVLIPAAEAVRGARPCEYELAGREASYPPVAIADVVEQNLGLARADEVADSCRVKAVREVAEAGAVAHFRKRELSPPKRAEPPVAVTHVVEQDFGTARTP